MEEVSAVSRRRLLVWAAGFVLATSAMAALGLLAYQADRAQMLKCRAKELTSAGALKTAEIAAWRRERLTDVARFARGPTLIRAIEGKNSADLHLMLSVNRKGGIYEDVLLVTSNGKVLGAALDPLQHLPAETTRAVAEALASRQPVLSDFYTNALGLAYIDAVMAVSNAEQEACALVLQCNASKRLYPLLQAYPGSSASVESVLVRRDGDQMAHLSCLRHQDNQAMSLKRPLPERQLPTMRAILGRQGIYTGTDCRGVQVVADLRPIPDSDWFLVTKGDEAELLGAVREHALIFASIILLGILLTAAITALCFRHRQASLYRSLYHAQREQAVANAKYLASERAAQKVLADSESRLKALISHVPGIVFRCGTDSYRTMQYLSANCRALTGYDAEALLDNSKLSYYDVIHPDDRQKVWDAISAQVKHNTPYAVEYRIVTVDGSVKWVWESGSAISDSADKTHRLEGVIHDITARRLAAERETELMAQAHQTQRLEALGRMAGGVAHDFNNALTVIIGNAEWLQDSVKTTEDHQKSIEAILQASHRAADLVNRLLGFAARQISLPRAIQLDETINRLTETMNQMLGSRIHLRIQMDTPPWPVMMDPGQMTQVLVNLVENARDAISGEGTVTVTLENMHLDGTADETADIVPPGDYVCLSFRDTGCGMDDETQAKIFDPFFSTKSSAPDMGMGVAIIYGIVKQNCVSSGSPASPIKAPAFPSICPGTANWRRRSRPTAKATHRCDTRCQAGGSYDLACRRRADPVKSDRATPHQHGIHGPRRRAPDRSAAAGP